MENQIFRDVNTGLDLNGPILSITQQPESVSGIGTTSGSTGGGSVELIGIATATFTPAGIASNQGTIAYQWYKEGVGALSDSTYITGTATTTLTLSALITPDDQGQYYFTADYIPTYSGVGDPRIGSGYRTGNALNGPIQSGIGTLNVIPMIEIIAQPSSSQAGVDINRTFTVNADLTDSSYGDDLTYQWIVDGVDISDGVITTTSTTSALIAGDVEHSYTDAGSHTIPSTATNISVVLAGAAGGNGGNDADGPGGRGAQGRVGRFTMPDGAKTLEFKIGRRGNDGEIGDVSAGGLGGFNPGLGDGGNGGGASQQGWTGGGGGAASYLTNDGSIILVSAGGGGGGGGSLNGAGGSGYNTDPGVGQGFTGSVDSISSGGAGTTIDISISGGGGGGGGGGAPGGDGGIGIGSFGNGGLSAMNPSQVTEEGSDWLNDGSGYANLKYTGYTPETVVVTRKMTVSGTDTNTLIISTDHTTVKTIQCRISSDTASNSPILTDQVNFAVVDTTVHANITIEEINNTDSAGISLIDLQNGEFVFEASSNDTEPPKLYSFYSPEKDLKVQMDLYGGMGENSSGINSSTGGEGGYSRIEFTMKQDVEYVLAGLIPGVNAPFLYRKGQLMAVVGEGGDGGKGPSGSGGNRGGGKGGGVGIGGGSGEGGFASPGGPVISAGGLSANGKFGSKFSPPYALYPGDVQGTQGEAGQTIKCTKGQYWAQQGKGACDDLGSVKFRLQDGTEVTNTSDTIVRGFKAGYNIMETGGWGSLSSSAALGGGDGGNGATGGQGSHWSGGGGGSGYQDGSVEVIDTMQGGSTFAQARVVMRIAND